MFSPALDREPPVAAPLAPAHILLVASDTGARLELADALMEAGFWLTIAPSFGLGAVQRDRSAPVDLVVTAQPMAELGDDAVIRLARTVAPDVPLLMLEETSASGPGVLAAVRQVLHRWATC